MQKSAFERTGLVPRSIIRTFDRFRRQLLPGAEDLVIQEFRVSKYQVLVSVRCLASLLFFPLLVNYLVKTTILIPLAEYIWNTQQSEIFLNFYQENRAFLEMRDFEEKIFFESLVSAEPRQNDYDTLVLHKRQNDLSLTSIKSPKMGTFYPWFAPSCEGIEKTSFIENLNLPKTFREKDFLIKRKIGDSVNLPQNSKSCKKTFFLETFSSQKRNRDCYNKNIPFNYIPNLKDSFPSFCEGKPCLTEKRGVSESEMTELNSNKIDLEKFNFSPKFKFDKVSPNLSITNPFFIQNKKEITQDYSANHGSEATVAAGHAFASHKQEATFFASTKNSLLSFEKNKDLRLNKKNTVSLLSEPDNLNKFHFLKQNLPIVDLDCEKKLCDFRNQKVKSGTFSQSKKTNKSDDILLQEKFQEKTIQLATFYNQQTISAIANVFGDFVTLITIAFLFVLMKPQIIILKSFLTESIYSLSDTTKSFLLILLTDLLVGFHSPRGWEILIEILLRHFGLPENQDFVFLFVATLPVLLDTVFKYWIFRYLNQISPSTVATYHSMIE